MLLKPVGITVMDVLGVLLLLVFGAVLWVLYGELNQHLPAREKKKGDDDS
jgi:hypothetical protein